MELDSVVKEFGKGKLMFMYFQYISQMKCEPYDLRVLFESIEYFDVDSKIKKLFMRRARFKESKQ